MSAIPTPITIIDMVAASPSLLAAVETSFDPDADLFNIPATPSGLRNLRGLLRNGRLSVATQRRIALAIGNLDSRVHHHVDHAHISDVKAQAGVHLAVKIAERDGCIGEADLAPARAVGYTASELLEIVGHVALNNLTNYIYNLFATGDTVPLAQAARAA